MLDVVHQDVERLMCVRCNQFELREGRSEGFDVISVLHFVEAIRRVMPMIEHSIFVLPRFSPDRQQCIHGSGDGD